MKKTQKGITLVALVITIIVLLILAVVAIGAVRDSGVIGHAQNSADKYNTGKAEEESMLGQYEEAISQYETDGKFETNGNGNGEFDTEEDIKWIFTYEDGITFYYIGDETEITLDTDKIQAFECEFIESEEIWKETDKVVTIDLVTEEDDVYIFFYDKYLYYNKENNANVEHLKLGSKIMNLDKVKNEVIKIHMPPNMKELTFLEGVEEIPEYFCTEIESLVTVNFPSSLKILRRKAISKCFGVTELTIPAGITLIEADAMPANVKKINFGGTMARWNSFGDLGLTSGAQVICSDGTITIQ